MASPEGVGRAGCVKWAIFFSESVSNTNPNPKSIPNTAPNPKSIPNSDPNPKFNPIHFSIPTFHRPHTVVTYCTRVATAKQSKNKVSYSRPLPTVHFPLPIIEFSHTSLPSCRA